MVSFLSNWDKTLSLKRGFLIQDDPEGMGDVLEDVMDRLGDDVEVQDQGTSTYVI